MESTIEKIPEYMLPYFVYGDVDNITEEDIQNAQEWIKKSGIKEVIAPPQELYHPYFTHYPSFGKACDVVECECVTKW